MRRVPATVITGFLGAGKTSLVRHLLARADGRRLAVVVNEFGELGIDRELLLGCGDAACAEEDIVELANGCICCTVAEDFLPTLTRLLDRPAPPEHILIETSGLALPKPLVQAFSWPEIRTRTTVDGVLTVIDGAAVAAGGIRRRSRSRGTAARVGSGPQPRQPPRRGVQRPARLRRPGGSQQGRFDRSGPPGGADPERSRLGCAPGSSSSRRARAEFRQRWRSGSQRRPRTIWPHAPRSTSSRPSTITTISRVLSCGAAPWRMRTRSSPASST